MRLVAVLKATAAAGAITTGLVGGTAWYAHRFSRAVERRHPPKGRFVEVGRGRRLHYVMRGEGPPVVLLHGASAQLEDMTSSLMPTLAERHRVVAFDRPGHGYSDRPPYRAWAEAQARVLHEGVRRLGLHKPIIVGHSMGGGVAIAYGMLYPKELTGVVFLSGLAFPELRPDFLRFAGPAIPLLGTAISHTIFQPVQRVMVPRMLRKFYAPQSIPAAAQREMPIGMLYRPKAIKANSEDQMAVLPSLIDLAFHYKRYPLPVTIFAGTEDQTTDPSKHAIRLSKRLPRVKLHMLEGMGHMVHHYAQREIAAAVDDLFAQSEHATPMARLGRP
jgi:pimeloyl-ACP methyl ester carboxylesterase